MVLCVPSTPPIMLVAESGTGCRCSNCQGAQSSKLRQIFLSSSHPNPHKHNTVTVSAPFPPPCYITHKRAHLFTLLFVVHVCVAGPPICWLWPLRPPPCSPSPWPHPAAAPAAAAGSRQPRADAGRGPNRQGGRDGRGVAECGGEEEEEEEDDEQPLWRQGSQDDDVVYLNPGETPPGAVRRPRRKRVSRRWFVGGCIILPWCDPAGHGSLVDTDKVLHNKGRCGTADPMLMISHSLGRSTAISGTAVTHSSTWQDSSAVRPRLHGMAAMCLHGYTCVLRLRCCHEPSPVLC